MLLSATVYSLLPRLVHERDQSLITAVLPSKNTFNAAPEREGERERGTGRDVRKMSGGK